MSSYYSYMYPAYSEAIDKEGFQGFGQAIANGPADRGVWQGIVTNAKNAITQAKAAGMAAGNLVTVASLQQAEYQVDAAQRVLTFQLQNAIWTEQGRSAVRQNLTTAEGAFRAAQVSAGTVPPMFTFPVQWPSMAPVAPGLPAEPTPTETPEAAPEGEPPPPGAPTVVVAPAPAIPKWALYGGLGLMALLAVGTLAGKR